MILLLPWKLLLGLLSLILQLGWALHLLQCDTMLLQQHRGPAEP
jgi:hypothetical protein